MFSKLLHKYEKDWNDAYIADAKFYQKARQPVGVFALVEKTDTVLPLNPYALIDGKVLDNWEMLLIPLGEAPIGSVNYYKAIQYLKQNNIDKKDDKLLVKGVSKETLQELYSKCI